MQQLDLTQLSAILDAAVQNIRQAETRDEALQHLEHLLLLVWAKEHPGILLHKKRGDFIPVPLPNIGWIEGAGNDSLVHVCNMREKQIRVCKQLHEFETVLSPFGFVRIEKSHLIGVPHIVAVDTRWQKVWLDDLKEVPVSESKAPVLKKVWLNMKPL